MSAGDAALARLHKTLLVCVHNSLDPDPQPQLGQDAAHMGLGGGVADEELAGDLGVGQAPSDEPQNLDLPLGETRLAPRRRDTLADRGTSESVDHTPGDCGVEQGVARGDGPDRGHELLGRRVLE